jgi:hypothetical protein
MSLLGAAWKGVDGRDKRGHDTWSTSVNLFAGWYYIISASSVALSFAVTSIFCCDLCFVNFLSGLPIDHGAAAVAAGHEAARGSAQTIALFTRSPWSLSG